MASALRHFADPHMLLRTQYNNTATHTCDICQSRLAGLTGYRCSACNFDIHEACADYFKETISFFTHPWHTLTLTRIPMCSSFTWSCDLCREECPQGNLVYRCVEGAFDVHPLCTMLPQTIRSPLHPQHDLRMVASGGRCRACKESLPIWHYLCSCAYPSFKVHIACVSGAPSGGTTTGQSNTISSHADQTSTAIAHAQGSSASRSNTSSVHVSGGHGGQTSTVTATAGQSRRSSSVAKFLLKTSFRLAINAATGGMASPVLEVLSAVFD